MIRNGLIACLFLLVLLIPIRQIAAHGAFYPHHLQDFGAIQARAEIRVTVLISTGVFVALLVGVIVLAIRRGQVEVRDSQKDHRKRLLSGLEAAAKAGTSAWPHDPTRALIMAIQAFADVTRVPWNPELLVDPKMPLRCQLGNDQLTISSPRSHGENLMEFRAVCEDICVRIVLDEYGNVRYDP